MNKAQRAKAKALAGCRLRLCSWDTRFAHGMAWIADHSPEVALTQKQKFALDLMMWRYRRQLAGRDDIELPTNPPDPDAYGVAPLEPDPDETPGRMNRRTEAASASPDPQRDLF